MMSPVGPQGRVEGVLALQFPISKINRLMTADRQWEAAGMGETGETFLVGPDDLMRSDSRLFLENPEEFKRDVVEAGTPPDVAEESIRQGGTTLVQPVPTEATKLAQRGQTGTLVEDDYLGHESLQAYAPPISRAAVDRSPRSTRPKRSRRFGVHQDARVVHGASSSWSVSPRCCWRGCSCGPSAGSRPAHSRSAPATTTSRCRCGHATSSAT